MRQIPYSSSSVPIHFEFPAEWDTSLVTAVSLTITDRDGDTLMAADSATMYTATSLDGAVDRFADSIILDSGAGALVVGDMLRLYGSGGSETVRVKGYNGTTYTATLEDVLDNEYADNDVVRAVFCNYTLDVSTVATFTAGLIMNFTWTPTGSGQPVTEQAQIAKSALDISGLERRFSRVYPRAYESFTDPVDRFADMAMEAELQIEQELLSRGLDIQRIANPDSISTVIMARMAYMWTLNGDKEMEDERRVLGGEYEKQVGWLMNSPVWEDKDQDGIEDDGETTDHVPVFGKGW